MPTLASALERYRVKDLNAFGALVLGDRPKRKAELVEAIAVSITAPGRLATVVGQLTPDQAAALAEAVHEGGGVHDPVRFRARHAKDADLGTRSRWGEISKPSLLHLFLHRPYPAESWRVPDELVEPLRAEFPEPPAPGIRSGADLPNDYPRPTTTTVIRERGRPEREVSHEPVPLSVRETEGAARHDLAAVVLHPKPDFSTG